MNNEQNYFVLINKVLTSFLAGLIAAGVGFGVYFGMNQLTGINVNNFEVINFQIFLSLLTGFLIANIVMQALNYYFFHILEKNRYRALGKNFGLNLISSLTVYISSIILCFICLTQSINATVWCLIGFVNFCLISGAILREDNRIHSNFIAMTTSMFTTLIMTTIVLITFKQSLGLAIITGILCLPLWNLINEVILSTTSLILNDETPVDVVEVEAPEAPIETTS
jgi:hypothetical protein